MGFGKNAEEAIVPVLGKLRSRGADLEVPFRNLPRHSSAMSTVSEFRWRTPDAHASDANGLSLFASAPICVAKVHPSGQISSINPALERMLGSKSKSDLVFSDLLNPQDHEAGQRLIRELFQGTLDHFQIDAHPAGPDMPSLRWVAWRVSTPDAGDYGLVFTQDTQPDAESKVRLRQAQRLEAVGRLAGGVAHDFNNLLTGILLYCDLLIASVEPGQPVRKYAEEIRNAGVQASGLVRQLLTLARPTNHQPRLLSLNEIAEAMRNLLGRLIGESIDLNLQLDPDLGLVKMDPTQAQQILLNLVLNSRDAMPSGGRIQIETRNCKVQVLAEAGAGHTTTSLPCALLVVKDTGVGMDEKTRVHVFEAFFTTKSNKGTGLGLATVHDIVSSNGGLIHVDSAPGQGTRISILLPLAPEMAMHYQNTALPEREGELLAFKKE